MISIDKIVLDVVQEVVDTLPESERFDVVQETVLFGANSEIDSMTLVSVIVDIEEILSDENGKPISLTDDRAMTREKSPFDTIGSLIEYIKELL